jgi:tetratricopeptide (TPR) repeat protein
VVLTAVAYAPAFRAAWIWDDDSYVTGNAALRTGDGLRRIWTEPGAVAQYYPLTFSTLWLQYQLHGASPAAYHAANVALHAASAVVLWLLARALGLPAPWLLAALFAVHPMHVESVAWVTERKNVLSGLFYLVAFLALVRWRNAREGTNGRSATWYGIALACFVAALLSKTVTSTLPIVFLIAVWWRTGRVALRDVVAMAPFVAAGLGLGSITAWLERTHVGAVGPYWNQTPLERLLIAGRVPWFYAGKLVVPWPLVFIYPRWTLDVQSVAQWLFPLATLVVGLGCVAAVRRWGRGPAAAVLAYGATLAPALGLVSVYPMRYSFVADHFAYLASIPLLALVVGLGTARLPATSGRVVAGAIVVVLTAATWSRCLAFRDAQTLWHDTIAKNPGATIAYLNLGYDLYQQGHAREALAIFDRGLALEPDAADLLNDRALALGSLGQTADAIATYRRAAAADPANAEVRSNLGNLLASLGRWDEALDAYREAVRLRPSFAEAHNNLANVQAVRGETADALVHYERALALDPGYAEAERNMAEVLLAAGRATDACVHFERALALRPRMVEAAIGRVRCLTASGRAPEAAAAGADAVHWATDSGALRWALARALAAAGRADEASAREREALALDPTLGDRAP